MILNFKHVLFVDISGNFLNLEAVDVLADMPFLVYLKAERNVIESAALRPIPFLQVINNIPLCFCTLQDLQNLLLLLSRKLYISGIFGL